MIIESFSSEIEAYLESLATPARTVVATPEPFALLNAMGPVSVSRLTAWQRCPQRWYQKYKRRAIESATASSGNLGKHIHALIAQAIAPETDTRNEEFPPEDHSEAREFIDLCVRNALMVVEAYGQGEPIVEQHFEVPLPFGVQLQGYIDYADDLLLIDWKTGGSVNKSKRSWQLPLYEFAAAYLRGIDPAELSSMYAYVGFIEPALITNQLSLADGIDWAERICREIESALEFEEFIGADAYPAQAGAHCSMCGYPCPHLSGFILPDEIESATQAREVAGYYIALEQEEKRAKSLLADFTNNYGPIEVGGEWFGMYLGNLYRDVEDKAGLYSFLEELMPDVDPLNCFKADIKALEKIMKDNPAARQALEAFIAAERAKPVFKHQKKAPPSISSLRRLSAVTVQETAPMEEAS